MEAARVEERETLRLGTPWRMSWGAIFAGTFVALGVWLLLYAFGLAVGLSSIDPRDPGSARAAGIGTGLWSVLSPLLALFVGGMVASRAAGVLDRMGGAIHGAVVWSFTAVAGFAVIAFVLSSIIGTAFSAGGRVLSAGGGLVGRAGQALPALGLNANDLLGPVNNQLREQGKPTVTSDQLQNVLRDVAQGAVRGEGLDREAVIGSITANTNLSRADAAGVADQIQSRVGAAGGAVQEGALSAASQTGKVFWVVFLALLFGLASAIAGALIGVSRAQRLYATRLATLQTTPTEARP